MDSGAVARGHKLLLFNGFMACLTCFFFFLTELRKPSQGCPYPQCPTGLSSGGIFLIKVLSFQKTIACVKLT